MAHVLVVMPAGRRKVADLHLLLKRMMREKAGAAMIEFAICSPLFFALLAGILCYGIFLGASHSVSQLAADAARASIAGLSNEERQKIATDHVQANAGSYPLIDPKKLVVTAEPAAGSTNKYRVSVSYDASQLPLSFAFIPSPNPLILRSAIITNGGN